MESTLSLLMEQKWPIDMALHQKSTRTTMDEDVGPRVEHLRLGECGDRCLGHLQVFLFDLYSRCDIQLYLYSLFTVGTRMVFKIA